MRLFSKKSEKKTYDQNNQKPVIKASICNSEQVAGFKDIHTGKFEENNNIIAVVIEPIPMKYWSED